MPRLNTADAIYIGSAEKDAVYLGSTLVWEKPSPGGFVDGLAAFLSAHGSVGTAFSFNQTGTNYGVDTSTDPSANSITYAQAETSVYANYGTPNLCYPKASSWFDSQITVDVAFLLYVPATLATGVYALFHNGGGTHGQTAYIKSTSSGTTIELGISHNQNGTNQDYTTVTITERGWMMVGFQFEDNSGNMAIWVNGANVAEVARTHSLAWGSGNPKIGGGSADPIPDWAGFTNTNDTGLVIANFVHDNPSRWTTPPAGNGDSFYTDYYAAMTP